MKERPILFSAPMVKAILDGRKSQTRRIVKAWGIENAQVIRKHVNATGWTGSWTLLRYDDEQSMREDIACRRHPIDTVRCPYGKPGDRLWVRETFSESPDGVIYRATQHEHGITECDDFIKPWKPSIFMPRNLSRITLEVTGVRVERLSRISEVDAIAEGCSLIEVPPDCEWEDARLAGMQIFKYRDTDKSRVTMFGPRAEYAALWNKINGAGSWESNPFVWVIEFRRLG